MFAIRHTLAPRNFVAGLCAIAATIATTALPFMVASAHAAGLPDDPSPRVEVSYADLDLATPKGHAALDRRIARAANQVCEGQPSRDEFARCHATALAGAHRQLATRAFAGRLVTR